MCVIYFIHILHTIPLLKNKFQSKFLVLVAVNIVHITIASYETESTWKSFLYIFKLCGVMLCPVRRILFRPAAGECIFEY